MRWVPLAFAGCMTLSAQGCSIYRQGAPSEREFRQSHAHPYVADAGQTARIIAGARGLHICSRAADVRKLMGEPDIGARAHDSSGDFTAARWIYFVREDDDPRLAQRVEVTINARHEVISIMPFGILSLPLSIVVDDPGCHLR
jgi:hypothetical protein